MRRFSYSSKGRIIIASLASCLIIFFGALTVRQNRIWENSLTLWGAVLEKYPEEPIAHNNLGKYYLDTFFSSAKNLSEDEKNDLLEKAKKHFELSIKYRPNDVKVYLNLATLYRAKREDNLAKEYLLKAIELAPEEALVYYNLGNFYFEQGQYLSAFAQYKKAIELHPDFPDAYIGIARVHSKTADFEAAISALIKALNQRPENAQARLQLAYCYAKLRKYDKAIGQYNVVIEEAPSQEAFLGLANCYLALRDREKALVALKRAFKEKGEVELAERIREKIKELEKAETEPPDDNEKQK
jgi:tetratricopeptide (TPR) repeat protein